LRTVGFGFRPRTSTLRATNEDRRRQQAQTVSPPLARQQPRPPIVEIAIYPDVIWLAARTLQVHGASYRTAV
jgi:hypothetical protein